MKDLVTLATFTYPTDLAIFRSRLESEGIECFVQDELTIQTHNLYSNAIGGVKLQVKESDAQKALEIYNAFYPKSQNDKPSKDWGALVEQTIKKITWVHILLIVFFTVAIALVISVV